MAKLSFPSGAISLSRCALLLSVLAMVSCSGGSLSGVPSASGGAASAGVANGAAEQTDLAAHLAAGYVRYACPQTQTGRLHCNALFVTASGLSALGYAEVVRPDDVAAGLNPDHTCRYYSHHHETPPPNCASPSPSPSSTATPSAAPTSSAPSPIASATAPATASPAPAPTLSSGPPPKGGYGPASLQDAYDIDSSGGAGRVVALVESGDAPTLEADLGVYRAKYGLSACTTANGCFRKVNQTGGSTLPKVDASWAQETSLDVDMVSALCPNCHILVVEAAAGGEPSDLAQATDTAANLGAAAISNSYGGPETSNELTTNAPAYNHSGIYVTVSTGDSGYDKGTQVEVPSVYSNVIAVGGTTLTYDPTTPRGWSETVWSGTSNGCSRYVPKPTWQHDTGCSKRITADVAFDADEETGVATYDSTPYLGQSGWLIAGGTSVGAPAIAAMYALVGNGLSDASSLYEDPSALYDITSGSTGKCSPAYFCTAEPGYDGPTGNGTPDGLGVF